MMPVPEYNVETVNSGTKVSGHMDPMGTHADFYKLLSSLFKMASDRAKVSNYVHRNISGTQGRSV